MAGPSKIKPLSAPVLQQSRLLAVPVALLLGGALVVQLLALAERKLKLCHATLVEIELERHDRHAFALNRGGKLGDLALMQQQFARPLGLVIEAVGLQVLGYVRVVEIELAAVLSGVAFRNAGLAIAQRFHLGAGKLN